MQYIGSRYVPKIYENSIDPSSPEWESGRSWEPFIIVTYNLDSYISKKMIPSTVGDPSTAPEYWARFGFYSGQIASLQAQIDAIRSLNTISELNGSTQFAEGDIIHVNGYYAPGDGGGCDYLVMDSGNSFTIYLANGLYAFPITNKPTPEMFGAHCDGVNDDAPYIKAAIDYVYFLNPLSGTIDNFTRQFGGGTVYFNAKTYTILSSLDACYWANLCLQGTGSMATIFNVDDKFAVTNYSIYPDLTVVPFNLVVNDITFKKTGSGADAIFILDRAYGSRFNRCRFIGSYQAGTYTGRGVALSTTVDVIFDECTFTGFVVGLNIIEYPYTYPTGVSPITQNTTVLIKDSICYNNNYGIQVYFGSSSSNYIQNLTLDNTIIEQNQTGISISQNIAANASQLVLKNCYLEVNSNYAISLLNCALIFDETNILNRTPGVNTNQIRMLQRRTNDNDLPIKNYVILNKADDLVFDAAQPTSRYWFNYFNTIYRSQFLSANTYERWMNIKTSSPLNVANAFGSVHNKGIITCVGENTFYKAKYDGTTTPPTFTTIHTDSNITIRSDGVIMPSEAIVCTFEY